YRTRRTSPNTLLTARTIRPTPPPVHKFPRRCVAIEKLALSRIRLILSIDKLKTPPVSNERLARVEIRVRALLVSPHIGNSAVCARRDYALHRQPPTVWQVRLINHCLDRG